MENISKIMSFRWFNSKDNQEGIVEGKKIMLTAKIRAGLWFREVRENELNDIHVTSTSVIQTEEGLLRACIEGVYKYGSNSISSW